LITGNSRYVNDTLTTITGNDGIDRTTIIQPQPTASSFSYLVHRVAGFERIDQIAFSYLGDSTAWWTIANANPEIMFWDNLTPGASIRIPQ
jgi:hypothetical protein